MLGGLAGRLEARCGAARFRFHGQWSAAWPAHFTVRVTGSPCPRGALPSTGLGSPAAGRRACPSGVTNGGPGVFSFTWSLGVSEGLPRRARAVLRSHRVPLAGTASLDLLCPSHHRLHAGATGRFGLWSRALTAPRPTPRDEMRGCLWGRPAAPSWGALRALTPPRPRSDLLPGHFPAGGAWPPALLRHRQVSACRQDAQGEPPAQTQGAGRSRPTARPPGSF